MRRVRAAILRRARRWRCCFPRRARRTRSSRAPSPQRGAVVKQRAGRGRSSASTSRSRATSAPSASTTPTASGSTRATPSIPNGEGPRLGVHLKPGLPDGSYTATYRVVSADGHIVSSGFVFSIGKAGQGAERDGRRADRRLRQRHR